MNFVLANMFLVLFFLSIQFNQIKFGIAFLTPEFVRGFSSFFLGGLTYLLYQHSKNLEIRAQEILGNVVFSIALIVLFLRNLTFDSNSKNAAEYLKFGDLSLIIFAFPLLLLGSSISSQVQRVLVFRPLVFTGDISFSIYMWHVPIQLLIILLAENFNMKITPGDTIFFLLYFVSVFLFAIFSTFLIEKPLQTIIKKKFLL